MKGFTLPLWPIRYKPLPDELLSSWMVRLAHGHGLKVQTFCNLIFGNQFQVWNRDIDRLAPNWLVQKLCDHTGTALEVGHETTLRSYEGWLYPQMRTSSTLQWITALKLHHRKFEGYGIQFCPKCLQKDSEPYFRKYWRVSINTICIKHNCMLHDRCPRCGMGVAFHRLDMKHPEFVPIESLATCHQCGFNLSSSPYEPIISYNLEIGNWIGDLSKQFTPDLTEKQFRLDTFNVLHQLAMLLTSRYATVLLHKFLCDQINILEIEFSSGRTAFETRPLQERHHLIQLIGWLMIDLEVRLQLAWRSKAVRYNHLFKDFEVAPEWYMKIIGKFSDWRER